MKKIINDIDLSKVKNIIIEDDNVVNFFINEENETLTIMSNIKDRGYVNIVEKKFHPTEIGIEVTDKLQEYFDSIINVEYTASMEEDLDKIAAPLWKREEMIVLEGYLRLMMKFNSSTTSTLSIIATR